MKTSPPDARIASGFEPVFLHSSYRTGSTWLWQKLREAPTTLAFYEIFNETLGSLKPTDVRSLDYASWDSRHPISAAYFMEFLPLLAPEGGVSGFEASMSFDDFIPQGGPDGELRFTEREYVDGLIELAREKKRIPVLSCTRSLGRARALRKTLGGRAILVHRNIFHQWASYCAQADTGNKAFFESFLRIVRCAKHDRFMSNVADWFGLESADPAGEELFQLFIIVHLYLYSIAFDAADLVVDVNDLARDHAVRRHVEHAIAEMIGSEVDLSDATEHCDFTDLTIACPRRMRDTIEQFSKLIPTSATTHDAIAFTHRIKVKALSEWERFEFFQRRSRIVYRGRLAEAQGLLDEQITRNDGLEAQNARLVRALAGEKSVVESDVDGEETRRSEHREPGDREASIDSATRSLDGEPDLTATMPAGEV